MGVSPSLVVCEQVAGQMASVLFIYFLILRLESLLNESCYNLISRSKSVHKTLVPITSLPF